MRTNSSKCKPDPRRAQIMRVKAQLARKITRLLAERSIPQTEAAALLGMSEPELSKMLCGQVGRFCLYELLKYFTRRGYDVHIIIQPRRDKPAQTDCP